MHVTSTGIAVALAVVIALGLLFFGTAIFRPFTTPSSPDTLMMQDASSTDAAAQPEGQPIDTNATELRAQDIKEGTGAVAVPGDTVTVQYVGALTDGTVFDASKNHGDQGFTFTLGAGQVIEGWDKGLVGMKEGGQRVLVIPPGMGYGAQANGPIPANATLVFEVELVSVKKSAQ